MTTNRIPRHLLGSDGLPCEGCEGSSGKAPITVLGFCADCRDAAFRDYPSRALELVGPDAPAMCAWYALCDHLAVGTTPHPILGNVPICERCADKHGLPITR